MLSVKTQCGKKEAFGSALCPFLQSHDTSRRVRPWIFRIFRKQASELCLALFQLALEPEGIAQAISRSFILRIQCQGLSGSTFSFLWFAKDNLDERFGNVRIRRIRRQAPCLIDLSQRFFCSSQEDKNIRTLRMIIRPIWTEPKRVVNHVQSFTTILWIVHQACRKKEKNLRIFRVTLNCLP